MHVTYFVNQYPKVSHSFIRREIKAIERNGIQVQRVSIRRNDAELVDKEDIEEQAKTQFILDDGFLYWVFAALKRILISPRRSFKALLLALKLGWRADRPLWFHLIYLLEAGVLLEKTQRFGSHHVHAHFGTNSAEIALLAHVLGGPPYSFTIHGPEEFDKVQALHLAEKIKYSKFVVSISAYGRAQLYRCVPHAYWNKIKVVHCGLEKSFHDGYLAGELPSSRFICVGRLCEQKGQMLLVEAVKKLIERNIDLKLVLAGDGEMRDDLESLISKLDLAENVKITGWISADQVRNEILNSRALVLPSFAEGLPVVIMEAMALGKPVLSTYVAGIPELVVHQKNGWLFPAGSVDDLVNALINCLETSDSKLSSMGDLGRERVVKRHNIDIEAGKLSKLFSADNL